MTLSIDYLAQSDSLRSLYNTVLTGKIIEEVLVQIAFHKNTPQDILEQLSKLDSVEVRSAVAANKNTPASILYCLASDPDSEVRKSVVANTSTPEKLLFDIVEDDQETLLVRLEIVHNPNAPAELLYTAWWLIQQRMDSDNELYDHDLRRALYSLVQHAKTPATALAEIAKLDDYYFSKLLLEHENTNPDVLKVLANSQHAEISKLAQSRLLV